MLVCTYWKSAHEPMGLRFACSVGALRERFERPLVVADKHALPGWAPVAFRGDRRALANVEMAYAIGLDLDDAPPFGDVAAAIAAWSALVHTTFSHTPASPRMRIVLFASRGMTAAEYRTVWSFTAGRVRDAGVAVDPAAKDPSRLWYVPGVAPGAEYRSALTSGDPLDVDAILRASPASTPVHAPPATLPRVSLVDRIERARKYLDTCDPAIAGQRGHDRTFVVAQKLVRGFELPVDLAFELLAYHFNPRCQPPWSEHELRRKCIEAARVGQMPPGALSNARRTG